MAQISKCSRKEVLAYLFGVYLGDGNVTKHRYFRMNVKDREFAEAVGECLARVEGCQASIKEYATKRKDRPDTKYANHFELFATAPDLCQKLESLTCQKGKIPDYIFTAPRSEKLYFIAGIMDSEGYVGEINRSKDPTQKTKTNRRFYIGIKSTDLWIPQFKELLESVGVKTGKIGVEENKKLPNRKPSQRFHINIDSWVAAGCFFIIKRKQERIDLFKSAEPYTMRSKHPRGGPKRLCEIPGCTNKHLSRGMCNKHYKQWQDGKIALPLS